MTDGMKTTEFWVTLLVTALAFIVSTGVLDADSADAIQGAGTEIITQGWELLAVVLPVFGYSLSRGFAKLG
jgi:uncharacterized membrane protein YqaE (UPF0057 family)